MWTISTPSARFADDKLASLSVECPRNLVTEQGFGLLVALWCGRIRDHIIVDGSPEKFSFGFLAGEVVVEPNGGRISNEGRLEVEAGRFKIIQSETDQTKKDGLIGAQFGFDIGKWFGLAKAAADLGGHLNRTVSKTEQRDGEYYQVFWRVADAGHNFWRVFGVGLNAESVLENKIIGDEPICHIAAEGSQQIEVSISFRCDLRDLWFQHEDPQSFGKDSRFSKEQEERNRTAIAHRVVAIALNRTLTQSPRELTEQSVVLARQRIRATRTEANVTA
jgi:hypothetical protein